MPTTTGKRALLAADTDRTLDYVFESAKLPEIRGASVILNGLNCEKAPKRIEEIDPSASKIYADGGSLLYEVAADRAPRIQRELEALYPRETGVATITCVYRVLSGPADEGIPTLSLDNAMLDDLSPFQRERIERADRQLDNFGAWVRLLGHDLRRRKREKRFVPFIEAMPYAARCRSCRTRPAQRVYVDYDTEWPRCPECAKKREHGARSPWRDRFQETLLGKYPDLASQYFHGMDADTVHLPRDLSVIASACHPRNPNKQHYVAFIYADGDGVGAFVESQRTRTEYERNSLILREATWHAVTVALARNLRVERLTNPWDGDPSPRPTHPFEIITVGGDDVMLIVPAHVALQVARDLVAEFRTFLDGKDLQEERPLSLSVGVVIAPMHMPVRLMQGFALELLKRGAKPRAREARTGAIDFQIFTSTALYGTGITEMRSRRPYVVPPPDDPRGKPLRLFYRPYTGPELDRLLRALRALDAADFPTSQLQALASALEYGRHRATLFYLYQRSRLKEKHRQALVQVETIVETSPDHDPPPWLRAPQGKKYAFATVLRDVAELYDFVPTSEGEEGA